MKNIFLGLLIALLAACGTDSGNPGYQDPHLGTLLPEGDVIAYQVCRKLAMCETSNYIDCSTGALTAANFTNALGLNPTTYPNYNSVIIAVDNGQLNPNSNQVLACQTAVDALSCNDPLVTTSYNPNQPTNFNNLYRMLGVSASCSQMLN